MKNLNSTTDISHVPWLDGIRGLAILLVVIGHYFIRFWAFQFGWIGLNLFFILSGYLITSRLFYHYASEPSNYFRNFYWRRIPRIFPLYYGCLAILFIILPIFYNKYEMHFGELLKIQGWYWSYLSNWRIIWFGLPTNPIFFHFWSLAVEEQYYLFWPIVFFLITTLRKRVLFISFIISLSIVFRIWDFGNMSAYYNTLTAAEPLLLGGLLCILEKSDRLRQAFKYFVILSAISIVMLIFIFIHDPNPFPDNPFVLIPGYTNIDLIWATLFCSLLLKTKSSRISLTILQSKFLIKLGVFSYGIYVFHWIILQLFVFKWESMLEKMGQPEWISYGCARVLGVAATLTAAYFSFTYFESKFLALKKIAFKKPKFIWKAL